LQTCIVVARVVRVSGERVIDAMVMIVALALSLMVSKGKPVESIENL
jgi:hypothetical protein